MVLFDLCCPFCGANSNGEDGTPITVELNDSEKDLSCIECDETFTVEEAVEKLQEHLVGWKRFSRWIEVAEEYSDGSRDQELQE